MTGANSDLLYTSTNVMSNDRLPATVIYDERRRILRRRHRRPGPIVVDDRVVRDGEHPGAQVLAVVQPAVRTERSQERLLERVLGSRPAEAPAQKPEHLTGVCRVERLERRNLRSHRAHHPVKRR